MAHPPVTILDVARRAGVSPATVSRVLNGSAHPVRAAVRRRVLAAVRVLGYFPNMLARGLLTGTTSAVALLIPDVSNPYYALILRGVEDVAREGGRAVILCNTDRSRARQRAYLRTLLERRVDGLIVAGGTFGAPDLEVLGGRVPVVTIGRHRAPLPSVRVDNVAAARLATRHLLALGHRRIACLAGPRTSTAAIDRVQGYRQALRDAGLAPRAGDVVPVDFTSTGGREGVRRLLGGVRGGRRGRGPTAIVAANDQVAVGALRALHELGLRVPDDVSMVGFDDTPLASSVVPALTSVAIPMAEMGGRAMALLLRVMRGEAAPSVLLPVELKVRESTAAPARRAVASAG